MNVPSWAEVGARIVCIEDRAGLFAAPSINYTRNMHGLRKGCEYTIRECDHDMYTGALVFRLAEIIRPLDLSDLLEVGFDARRFRPLISKEDDMKLFTSLLNPSPSEIEATLAPMIDALNKPEKVK